MSKQVCWLALFYAVVLVVSSGCGKGSEEQKPSEAREPTATELSAESTGGALGDLVRFAKWGISFEYPARWSQYPDDRLRLMREHLAAELRPYDREVLEFAMITSPDNEIALLVTKYTTTKPLKPADLIAEREQVYEDAIRSGDVTKVNHLRETTFSNLPVVEEDVERSNGGRGRTYKVISGKVVYELSFVVRNKQCFPQYIADLKRVMSTVEVSAEAKTDQRTHVGSKDRRVTVLGCLDLSGEQVKSIRHTTGKMNALGGFEMAELEPTRPNSRFILVRASITVLGKRINVGHLRLVYGAGESSTPAACSFPGEKGIEALSGREWWQGAGSDFIVDTKGDRFTATFDLIYEVPEATTVADLAISAGDSGAGTSRSK